VTLANDGERVLLSSYIFLFPPFYHSPSFLLAWLLSYFVIIVQLHKLLAASDLLLPTSLFFRLHPTKMYTSKIILATNFNTAPHSICPAVQPMPTLYLIHIAPRLPVFFFFFFFFCIASFILPLLPGTFLPPPVPHSP